MSKRHPAVCFACACVPASQLDNDDDDDDDPTDRRTVTDDYDEEASRRAAQCFASCGPVRHTEHFSWALACLPFFAALCVVLGGGVGEANTTTYWTVSI